MKPEPHLPQVRLSISRQDFNYIKRAVLSQKDTTAKRRVKKMLWGAQKEFFEDRRRLDRERKVDRETYTLKDAVEILRNAHYYIMRTHKAFWYDKKAMEASKILCGLASDLRKEKAKSAFSHEDTRSNN